MSAPVRVTDSMVHAFDDAYSKNWEAQRCAPEGTNEQGTFFATRAGLEAALSAHPSPAMESMGERKLHQLQGDGFIVNGVAIFNPETGRRGLVDNLGYVGWMAQPSPGGQGDLLPLIEEAIGYLDLIAVQPPLVDQARRVLARALAARQPVEAAPQGCDACDRTGIRQNDEGRNICCPDCDLGSACAGDTRHPVGEPVAEVSRETFSSDGTSDIIKPNLPIGTKLYAAPPAQQPAQVYLDGLDRALGEAIDQRDRYHEVADDLAGHIAAITGVDIGEHSSANCPWQNAIEAAEEYKPAQAVDLPYSLDADQAGIRASVCDVITGTLMVGAQGHTPPPAGHWAEPFWKAARADAAAQAVELGPMRDVFRRWHANELNSTDAMLALVEALAVLDSQAVGK